MSHNVDVQQPLLHNRNNGRRHKLNSSSQSALVGSQISHLESLDYEILESELIRQDWRSRNKVEIFHYVWLKWTLAFLIGLFVGLIASFVNLVIENIAVFKLKYVANMIVNNRSLMGFGVLTVSNLVLTFLSSSLTAYVGPSAAGAGVPEIKAYLNGVDLPDFFGINTLFVKVFGSIFACSAGLDLGKEGPLIHTGSCIASILGQGGSKKYRITWRWLKYFKNDRDRRDLITCGAAAGVAAAFRAPIGGVLFALEEIATWWRSAILWRTFFTTAIVAVVLRGFIDYCENGGSCGLFGNGGLIIFDVSSATISYKFVVLIPVVILGVIGGFLGAIYNYLLARVLKVYAIINQKGKWSKILLSLIVALITSVFVFSLPWLASCTPCPTGIASNGECKSTNKNATFKQFQCPSGYYNDLASLLLNTNDGTVKNIFSLGTEGDFSLSSLMIYNVAIFILGLITYGLALPSGLFIPVILIGATYGRALGKFFEPLTGIDQGLCAVLGAASLLGGSMRMTVSLCVILLELTNNLTLLPFVMLVLLISKTIGDAFNSSVYDQIVHLKGLPFLEAHAEPYMRQISAADVITNPLVTFRGVEKIRNIMQTLTYTNHSGFPVLDEKPGSIPILHGLILRSHLLVLLTKKNMFQETPEVNANAVLEISQRDFAKPGSGKGLTLNNVKLTEEELEMYIDLHPFCNTSPYTVTETTSLAKAYALFRHLGLRHLCVVPREPLRSPIVGILTRHDFMPEHIFDVHPYLAERKRKRLGT